MKLFVDYGLRMTPEVLADVRSRYPRTDILPAWNMTAFAFNPLPGLQTPIRTWVHQKVKAKAPHPCARDLFLVDLENNYRTLPKEKTLEIFSKAFTYIKEVRPMSTVALYRPLDMTTYGHEITWLHQELLDHPDLDVLVPRAYDWHMDTAEEHFASYKAYVRAQIRALRKRSKKPVVPIINHRYTGSLHRGEPIQMDEFVMNLITLLKAKPEGIMWFGFRRPQAEVLEYMRYICSTMWQVTGIGKHESVPIPDHRSGNTKS